MRKSRPIRKIPPCDTPSALREQLEYLLTYHGVHGDCMDCDRLAAVAKLLLEPFAQPKSGE